MTGRWALEADPLARVRRCSDIWGQHEQRVELKLCRSGWPACPGNSVRFSDRDDRYPRPDRTLTSDDPQTVELMKEFMKEFVKELPWLPMFGTSKFVPVDTYYWTNFPAGQLLRRALWWWSLFKYMTPHFEPTGR